ncbi:MAG TPA: S53 family peptidase [Silvibacterium sp.]|nr:S53 family peptidase [Silvibacterium sp.]
MSIGDLILPPAFTKRMPVCVAAVALSLLPSIALHAQTALEAPKIIEHATDHGPAPLDKSTTVIVHLKMRDQAGFDRAVAELYRAGSPTYHHWMTPAEIGRHGASAADLASVEKELKSHGLQVLEVAPNSSLIRARGTTQQLEETFQTQIHEFEREGITFHANVVPAKLTGEAGGLIKAVDGLTNMPMKPHLIVPKNPRTGKPLGFHKVAAGTNPNLGSLFTDQCFTGAGNVQLAAQANPPLPAATYYGNIYDAPEPLECGYTPAQMQAHYGLSAAYHAGYQGAGQTIVLVDGPSYGQQVTTDLYNFSRWTNLPATSKSNFSVIYPDGQPSAIELEYITNWTEEADLDVQWAHAIAPKAKIDLLITPTQDWSELEYAIEYAVKNHLGNVISNSYGYPEFLWGYQTSLGFDAVLESAAAQGVTVNFSSGDSGDEGTGAPNLGGASYPATSAYATAIGGTSIGIANDDGSTTDVGWGNNQTLLSVGWTYPVHPSTGGFSGGSGGGESTFYAKPAWQGSLSGTGRQEPDISAVADPYTGAIFVYYGQLGVIGGTSLASPVFSGIWALASEKAGSPLGQAAPLFSSLPAGAITDVVPTTSPLDVAGIYFDTTGSTLYTAASLAAPLENTTEFYSTLWDFSGNHSGDYAVLTFGTDTSLTVTSGWDNVTGWGTPNGYKFITDVAAAVTANTKQ